MPKKREPTSEEIGEAMGRNMLIGCFGFLLKNPVVLGIIIIFFVMYGCYESCISKNTSNEATQDAKEQVEIQETQKTQGRERIQAPWKQ